jgi:hypothetical protein
MNVLLCGLVKQGFDDGKHLCGTVFTVDAAGKLLRPHPQSGVGGGAAHRLGEPLDVKSALRNRGGTDAKVLKAAGPEWSVAEGRQRNRGHACA